MRQRLRPLLTAIVAGLLLVGGLAVDAGAATRAATKDGPGLRLTVPRGAHVAGEPLTVTLSTDGPAAAFEGVLTFDPTAISFGGATAPGDARVLAMPQGGRVAIAALPCRDADCPTLAPAVTVTLTPLVDGRTELGLDATMVIGRDGAVASTGGLQRSPLAVGRSTRSTSAPAARWRIDRTPAPVPADSLDVTGDGAVTGVDLTEGVIAWLEGHVNGDPCALDPTSAAADVHGDGCVDVADLESLRRAVGTASATAPPDGSDQTMALGSDGSTTAEEERPRGIRGARAFTVASTTGSTAGTDGTAAAASSSGVVARPPLVVDSTGDETDDNRDDGRCLTSAGTCTLRAAIQQANADPGPNRIEFAIPGSGIHTIQLTSRLPSLNDTSGPVVVDGYTQPGATPNTDPLVSNAQIRVEVRGEGLSAGQSALSIASARNTIRGLAIYDNRYSIRVVDEAADANLIVGNFIGTNAAGTFNQGTGFSLAAGVWIYDGPDANQVGTAAVADRNVISGNRTVGIKIEQRAAEGNVAHNNILGLNPSGTNRLPNNAGFDLQWYTVGNRIGGPGPGEGNLVSGNTYTGVDLSHSTRDNIVERNLIGTWPGGLSASSTSGNGDGVMFKDNAYRNTIRENVIAGNRLNGIWNKHNYTDRNTIVDNWIGVGVDGRSLPNSRWGIWLSGESDIIERNWIANNASGGIYVTDASAPDPVNPPERTRENRISANTFSRNGGLGIDIEPVGVNHNDPGDTDTGAHDKLNFPEVGSLVEGRVEGTACAGCSVELYVADTGTDTHGEGRQLVGAATASATGAFSIDTPSLVPGRVHTLLTINERNDTSEFSPRFSVGSPSAVATAAPVVPDPGSRSHAVGAAVDEVTGATDPDADVLTHVAAGLPSGLRIDRITGAITGTPTAPGTWTTTVAVFDGTTTTAVTFPWTITGNRPPAITTAPAALTAAQGVAVSFPIEATDPDADDLTWSALGLPAGLGIDPVTGLVAGTPSAQQQVASTILASDGINPPVTLDLHWTVGSAPFACTVDGPSSTLSWTDMGQSNYNIRHLKDGKDVYVGATSGTSYPITDLDGTYLVRYRVSGVTYDTTCPAPGSGGP